MTAGVQKVGDRLAVTGKMTIETARGLLLAGNLALQGSPGEVEFDLVAVEEVDSAGLAVLFGWQREVKNQGKSLRIANSPRNLASLAEVYGVGGLLPLV